jgi:hypothetical protein
MYDYKSQWANVAASDYVTHEIFSEELTGPTERQLKEIIAEIMRESGITPQTDFAFKVVATWRE